METLENKDLREGPKVESFRQQFEFFLFFKEILLP